MTAYNPDGEDAKPADNFFNNAKLRPEIDAFGSRRFPVTGGDERFEHAEVGYGIECSREAAIDLAKRFRQEAIFSVTNGEITLIWTNGLGEPDEFVGRWEERLVSKLV